MCVRVCQVPVPAVLGGVHDAAQPAVAREPAPRRAALPLPRLPLRIHLLLRALGTHGLLMKQLHTDIKNNISM